MQLSNIDSETSETLRPYEQSLVEIASENAKRSTAPPKRFPIDRSGLRWLFRTIDVVVSLLAVFLTSMSFGPDLLESSLRISLPYALAPFAAFIGMRISGGYWLAYDERASTHMTRTLWGASLGCAAILAFAWVFKLGGDLSLLWHVISIMLLALAALHAHYIAIVKALTRAGKLSDNVVIVGATNAATNLVRKNGNLQEFNILGVFDDRIGRVPSTVGSVPVLGTVDDLLSWDRLPTIDRIIVTVTSTAQGRVRTMVDKLRMLPQEVILVLDLEGFAPQSTSVAKIVDEPAAYISGAPRDARRAAVKRATDIGIGGLMLLAFSPIMLLVAILIKLDSKGPVFFRQKRHGFNNQIIRVWKFRSMRPDAEAEEGNIRQTVADDDRVTGIGAFLRRTSLDELPQLFNILRGEMSLVGPRPHAVGMTTEEIEVHRIVGEYAHRHRMKPGLTGWAQINGSRGPVHTAELVKERVELDMEYVERASFWFDLRIIIMTAPCLIGDSQIIR